MPSHSEEITLPVCHATVSTPFIAPVGGGGVQRAKGRDIMWTVVEAKCNGSWGTNETLLPAAGNVATCQLRILFGISGEPIPSFIYQCILPFRLHRVRRVRAPGREGLGIPVPPVRMIHEAGKGT